MDTIIIAHNALVVISGDVPNPMPPHQLNQMKKWVEGKLERGARHGTLRLGKTRYDFVMVPDEGRFAFIGPRAQEYARNMAR